MCIYVLRCEEFINYILNQQIVNDDVTYITPNTNVEPCGISTFTCLRPTVIMKSCIMYDYVQYEKHVCLFMESQIAL